MICFSSRNRLVWAHGKVLHREGEPDIETLGEIQVIAAHDDLVATSQKCERRTNIIVYKNNVIVASTEFDGYARFVNSLAFSPDGTVLAASINYACYLFDVATWKYEEAVQYRNCISVAFSPDGAVFATGAGDFVVRLWSRRTGAILFELGESQPAWTSKLTFSSDSKKIASLHLEDDGSFVCLWDVGSGARIATLRAYVTGLAFLGDRLLMVGGNDDVQCLNTT